jgi:hypothetical protein
MSDKNLRETLAAEAAEAEPRRGEAREGMQRARTGGGASLVYTVRMPHDRIDELRALAGEQPTALMRR